MSRASGSLTIKDFPTDRIEVECKKSGRKGRYRKTSLIEKYGSDLVLADLLALIAGDCKFRGKKGTQSRGAIYPALGHVQNRNPPLEFG